MNRHGTVVNQEVSKLTIVRQRVLDLDDSVLVPVAQQQIHRLIVRQADCRNTIDLMDAVAGRQEVRARFQQVNCLDYRRI